MSYNVEILNDETAVAQKLYEIIVTHANKAISSKGLFTIGVSGGSVAKYLCNELSKSKEIAWDKWRIFFCDERHVPITDPESTYAYYKHNLFDLVSVPQSSIFTTNLNVSVQEAAKEYEKTIVQLFNKTYEPASTSFDLLILGIGPDGHTCSLFPNHSLLEDNSGALVGSVIDSPKPPPQRVTFLLSLLNRASTIAVVACGESKAEILKEIFENDKLPISRVKPNKGQVIWFIDKPAAKLIKS